MRSRTCPAWLGWLILSGGLSAGVVEVDAAPFLETRLIFPAESWHVHASCVVELPNGDLLAVWFHGSGERTADDVKIEGARLKKGNPRWNPRFVMADTPGYPDCNPAVFIDPQGRLWLLWPTILSNQWESALMKYRISSDYLRDGPPRWELQEVLHVTPGAEFEPQAMAYWQQSEAELMRTLAGDDVQRRQLTTYLETVRGRAADKLSRRLGWMTRAHPVVLNTSRLIVPLYSDGFDFSLMAITDDWGATWRTSSPLVGAGNIQPSIVQRRDGSLYTLMRDNGPPPKRLLQSESRDGGETWSQVTDSDLPNPGSGAEVIALHNGHWLLISNDTEQGRHRLAVQLSEDEGRSWPWKRSLEEDPPGPDAGRYHYPSLIQAADGTLHATYSHHLQPRDLPLDPVGRPAAKSIKHAHFNEAWVRAGRSTDSSPPP
jgi:predicted neuraminidase